jgi:hypothetical protein
VNYLLWRPVCVPLPKLPVADMTTAARYLDFDGARRRGSHTLSTVVFPHLPSARSIARAVRSASGMVTCLPPLRSTRRVRCPTLDVQMLDVDAQCFGDPQPVQGH